MALLLTVAACSSEDPSSDDPAVALARRVHDVLASPGGVGVVEQLEVLGVEVDADALADATPVCPRVEDPEPGDEATCRLTAGGHELEIDVAFEADGSIQLVGAGVAP